MSDDRPPIPRNRIPLAIGSLAVVIAAIVAIAVGVNSATSATPPPTPVPSPTVTATPVPSPIPFADCTKEKFGLALAPLNPPANVHTYSAAPAMTIDTSKLYEMTIVTSKGSIVEIGRASCRVRV